MQVSIPQTKDHQYREYVVIACSSDAYLLLYCVTNSIGTEIYTTWPTSTLIQISLYTNNISFDKVYQL